MTKMCIMMKKPCQVHMKRMQNLLSARAKTAQVNTAQCLKTQRSTQASTDKEVMQTVNTVRKQTHQLGCALILHTQTKFTTADGMTTAAPGRETENIVLITARTEDVTLAARDRQLTNEMGLSVMSPQLILPKTRNRTVSLKKEKLFQSIHHHHTHNGTEKRG